MAILTKTVRKVVLQRNAIDEIRYQQSEQTAWTVQWASQPLLAIRDSEFPTVVNLAIDGHAQDSVDRQTGQRLLYFHQLRTCCTRIK
jgi:hypothetical protein